MNRLLKVYTGSPSIVKMVTKAAAISVNWVA